jgi:PAS domain S-box-containing protein
MKTEFISRLKQYATRQNILLNIALAIVYFIAGKFGLSLAFDNPSASPIWAPTGIALAAILMFKFRVTPAIFLSAFLVNFTTAGNIFTSVGIAVGNSLEALVGAYLINRYAGGILAFEHVADIFRFTLFALISTAISATLGTLTLEAGGLATWPAFSSIWLTWWLGDLGGALIITPLILIWWTHHRLPFTLSKIVHFLLCVFVLYLVTEIIFSGIIPYPYLYIPLAVWIAFWFGRRGATVTTIIVAATTIFYTLSGRGPFVHPSLNESLIQLQVFLATYSLTSLIFAATVLEIRKTEKTLESHEQRFKALIENSFDSIVLVNAASKILYASPSNKRVLDYLPEELVGMTGFNLIDPADKQRVMGLLAQLVLKPKGVINTQYRAIKKDGTVIWVEATGTNLLFEPSVNAVVVNFRDVTQEKKAKDTLLQEKLEGEAMLGSIGDGIIATDNTGKITMLNQAACDSLGWTEKELMGASIFDAIPMQDATGKVIPPQDRPITKLFAEGKPIVTSRAINYIRKDGSTFPVYFTLTPIILEEEVVGAIEVFHDITREKEIDKAKTEFVSVASHQLRTPLATINWYLEELLRKGQNMDEKQTNYLREVYGASKRMVGLINALLNASRLELGTFMVEPQDTDVVVVTKQVLQDLRSQIEKKQLTIEEVYQEALPHLSADAKLLTIILQNLLSNAIKYSRQAGKVTVKIAANEYQFVIEVLDNGYGIPKNQQNKIFTKLFRADNARTIAPEGTGLGLYIVKAIIEAAGGKISFASIENKGTSFAVAFPKTGMKQKQGAKLLR